MSIALQDAYIFQVIAPTAIVDDASWTTAEIDTVVDGVKYDQLTIIFSLGAMDIAMAALKLQSSDTTGSGFADVSGAIGGTDFSLPAATDDNKHVVSHVRAKKRYYDLVATGGNGATGTYASAIAILTRGKRGPTSATLRGVLAEVIV